MKITRFRPFNITGPRKIFDACSDFARGIVEIENGKTETMNVSNLETIRDIMDFIDGIEAIWLIAQKGIPSEVYNICYGKGRKMRDILNMFISLSNKQVKFCHIPEKMRPVDDSIPIGDNTKLLSLGWKPKIPFEKTIADILYYWRSESSGGQKVIEKYLISDGIRRET